MERAKSRIRKNRINVVNVEVKDEVSEAKIDRQM